MKDLATRALTALGAGLLALALACPLAACAPDGAADDDPAPAETGTSNEGYVSTALVVLFGADGEHVLFVDCDTEAPYYPTLPDDAPELSPGNVVRVTGNGIMLESYPAQYPGITEVEVLEEGSPEDVAAYDELVSQVWQEPDPSEPPSGSVDYATDLAAASVTLPAHGYAWSFEEGDETRTIVADVAGPAQVAADDLPDVVVEGTAEVQASFSAAATSAAVERYSEREVAAAIETAGSATAVATDAVTAEPVSCEVVGGKARLVVEPGWRYHLTVEFDGGTVGYLFTVRAPA